MRFKITLAAVTICAATAVASAQTPLLRYTYDEPSGSALDTGTPPAADGTLVGGATRVANTPSGTGLALDLISNEAAGGYAYVNSADPQKLDALSQFTLTTWVNLAEGGTGSDRLLAKQAAGTFAGFNWSIHDPVDTTNNSRAAGDVKMGLFVGGDTAFTFAYSTADVNLLNDWKFLAVTYDGTQTADNVRYYVGGINTPVTQLGSAVTVNAGATTDSAAAFGIGFTDAAAASDTSPNGLLDDSSVFGNVLSLAQLDAIRTSAVPEPASLSVLGLAGLALLRRRRA